MQSRTRHSYLRSSTRPQCLLLYRKTDCPSRPESPASPLHRGRSTLARLTAMSRQSIPIPTHLLLYATHLLETNPEDREARFPVTNPLIRTLRLATQMLGLPRDPDLSGRSNEFRPITTPQLARRSVPQTFTTRRPRVFPSIVAAALAGRSERPISSTTSLGRPSGRSSVRRCQARCLRFAGQ
jgi:hypothetical protein